MSALIADLGSSRFATREKATAVLQELGPLVEPTLREAVVKPTSAEARRRIQELLRDLDNGVIPPQELRALRAVEVLEWIASGEAHALLLELSKGTPQARLTRHAAAASRRISHPKM